jgi:hypothetical protein
MVRQAVLLAAAILIASPVAAQEQIIYPAQGQSPEQLEQDRFQCYTWARDSSGFDPMAPPVTQTAPPQPGAKQGGTLEGAGVGALAGGAIGGIATGSRRGLGRGLAAGAVTGGILGTVRRDQQLSQEQQARQQWEQQETSRYVQARDTYNRAFAACMEGRGYTVR